MVGAFREAGREALLDRILRSLPEGSLFEMQTHVYIMEAWNIDAETLNGRLKELKPQPKGGEDMGPASRLIETGRVQGKAEMLTQQLERRFGALPQPVQQQLADASSADLDAWSHRVFDAASLEAVFGGAAGEAQR